MISLAFDIAVVILTWCGIFSFLSCHDILPLDGNTCWNKSCGLEFDPYSPLI